MIFKANLVDISNSEIYPARIETSGKKIISITKIDEKLSGYILPGFIDSHIHIESSMLIPTQFASLALLHGTVACVSDPHEIANVMGIEGIEFMLENANNSPFKFYFGASPCVPATPFETSGATLGIAEIKKLLKKDEIKYLSEVMNFPAVIQNEHEIMAKIQLSIDANKPIDGHAPALRGDNLNTYIDAGISTDHEAFSYEEAKEKLDKGMKILIREGSAAKNFDTLEPLIDKYYKNMMFCSDDKHPDDLKNGHINTLVIRAIKNGNNLFKVLQMACINPVQHYKLDVGCLHVNDYADFIEVKDLKNFELVRSVINGKIIMENSKVKLKKTVVKTINNFHTTPKTAKDFEFTQKCDSLNIIGAIENELVTDKLLMHYYSKNGFFIPKPKDDILKIAVVNRYKNRKPFVSFIHGFGLKNGAIASSIAHDSHNIISVGCSDEEIAKAVNLIIQNRGGISAVNKTEKLVLKLDIAGLMSQESADKVADSYTRINTFTKTELNSTLKAPFMTLSFMALLVIPSLKISDKGLFDSSAFHFIKTCSS